MGVPAEQVRLRRADLMDLPTGIDVWFLQILP